MSQTKSETMKAVVNLLNIHYGFTQFFISWQLFLKQWDLWVYDITESWSVIHVKKDNPDIILIGLSYSQKTQININDPKWQHLLITEVDKWIKQEELRKLQREIHEGTIGRMTKKEGN